MIANRRECEEDEMAEVPGWRLSGEWFGVDAFGWSGPDGS